MALVTLETLRTQAKQRSDLTKSRFIDDAEWNNIINLVAAELYDLLVATAEDYYTIPGSVTVDGNQDSVALPSNLYKLIGVDYLLGGLKTPMDRFMFRDRLSYQYQGFQTLRYRLVGSTLYFTPRPPAQTFDLWLVPKMEPLVNDTDTFDGVNGFEEYIILGSAIMALIKEESDPSGLMALQAAVKQRIIDMAPNRDQGLPERVTDVNTTTKTMYNLGFYDGI